MVPTCTSSVASERVGDVLSDEVRMLARIGHRLLGEPHDHPFTGALAGNEANGSCRAEVGAGASGDDKGPRLFDGRVGPFVVGDGTDRSAREVEGDDPETAGVLHGRREGERRGIQALRRAH